MSDTVLKLREALAVCRICMDEFDELLRLPRRMPCCGQPICQACLTSHIRRRKKFPCPLCWINVDLPGGPTSLPKDLTVFRFLDVLKTSKDALPSCTDCPDNYSAMATCEDCGVYPCEACFNGYDRHRSIRSHKTSTFEDITARASSRPQSATRGGASRVDTDIEGSIKKSQKKATELINQRFDDMVEELQHRRGILLSQVKAKADRELKSTRRALESHKTLQDELRSAIKSGHSAPSLQTPEDVGAERVDVSFTEVYMEQLLSSIRSAGQISVISYSPTQRPRNVPADQLYNAVRFTPDYSPEVPQVDVKLSIGGKDVIGPRLEFDHNTASADVQITSRMVRNTRPAPQDTWCRLQSGGKAVTLRPLPLKRGQVGVFSTRVVFTVKKLTEEGMVIWETSVTGAPVDAGFTQPSGLSVRVSSCSTHKQHLCLWVVYDDKLLTDVPLIKNLVGVSSNVNLGIVIDRGTNKIHVVDITDVKVVTTTVASLDRPLWVLSYVSPSSYCEMTSELISGRDLTLTPEMKHLLSSMI